MNGAALMAMSDNRVESQMDYQLVIKFWRKSLEDETFLPAIQSELKGVLGDAAELDGYDMHQA